MMQRIIHVFFFVIACCTGFCSAGPVLGRTAAEHAELAFLEMGARQGRRDFTEAVRRWWNERKARRFRAKLERKHGSDEMRRRRF